MTLPGIYLCMETNVVMTLSVEVPIACQFWRESDVWKAVAPQFQISVCGSSFEDAKRNLQEELKQRILHNLRTPGIELKGSKAG